MAGLDQTYTGRCRYPADLVSYSQTLFVAVRCWIADLSYPVYALLGTGSQWCVLPPNLARDLEYTLPAEGPVRLHTRFGSLQGSLERINIRLGADDGLPLDLDATCYVSPEWPGPFVLGWKGALERIRFALDPPHERFYFAGP